MKHFILLILFGFFIVINADVKVEEKQTLNEYKIEQQQKSIDELKAEIKDLKSALEKNGGVTRKTHERVAHELKQVREELADLKRPIIRAQIEKQNAELRELLLNQKQNSTL